MPTTARPSDGNGTVPRPRRLRRAVAEAIRAFRRDLNAVMSRGVWRIFAVALQQYQRRSTRTRCSTFRACSSGRSSC